jgi:hypothetical protein
MRPIAHVLIGACLVATFSVRAETHQLGGRFMGSGRACYGPLTVGTKTISWLTPFSQCKSVPYALIERDVHGDVSRVTYRLKTNAGSCRYTVLSLTHKGGAAHTGWDVTGYGSEQSYQDDKASGYQAKSEDIMSCYLIRDPGK